MTRFAGERGARRCRECDSLLVPGEGPLCLGCADGGDEAYGWEPPPPRPYVKPEPRSPGPADPPGWLRSGRHG